MTLLDRYFLFFFAAFAFYFLLCVLLQKKKALVFSNPFFYGVLSFAFLLRLFFFFQEPLLSDDIFRYLWDGKVIANGFNPYAYAPDSLVLSHLREDFSRFINHPSLFTVYPPLSQIIFLGGYLVGAGIYGVKFVFILFDLGIIIILSKMLKLSKQPKALQLIYTANPLVILEFYASSHTEAAAAFFLLLSFYFIQKEKFHLALIGSFLSGLVKYYGFLLSPLLVRRIPLLQIIGIGLGCLLFFFCFWNSHLLQSFLTYNQYFEFNGLSYNVFKGIFNSNTARLCCFGIFIVFYSYQFFKNFKKNPSFEDLLSSVLMIFTAFFLLAPTLYPWYLTLIIPLLVFDPNLSLKLFSGLIFMSYLVLYQYHEKKIWLEQTWVLWVEYLPFVLLLLYEQVFKNQKKYFKTRFKNPSDIP
jgi:hypothetical protein